MDTNTGSAERYTTPSDTEIFIARTFEAPRRHVWDSWTMPRHVACWMLGPEGWTMPLCEMDVRPGGHWRMAWHDEDGNGMEMHGTYREVVAPERLVTSESWGADWADTVNSVVLSERAGTTTMELTIRYPTREARDAALETGMTDGMALSFDRLERNLAQLS